MKCSWHLDTYGNSCVFSVFSSYFTDTAHHKQLLPANLKLPDLLALLRHLPHRLPHQSDQHVQQQHEGEDDVGNQQDEEDCRILCAIDHVQFSHPNGQLKEVQKEVTEGVWVPAHWVGRAAPVTLCARWRTDF